jgi:uncharacterized protein YdeI (YjbR/CyaY-like superfamily)
MESNPITIMHAHAAPTFFTIQSDLRKWFEENHETESVLLIGFYKVDTKIPSITWGQSVDEALCFGWIDGVRKSIDQDSYQIRFTKRKPTSIWSAVNINRVHELIQNGLMQPSGFASFEKRMETKSRIYSYEKEEMQFSPDLEAQFRESKLAWEFFQSLAPSYRKPSINWIMSAKQPATRQKRLVELIADSQLLTNKWKDNKYKK